jgi:hypothetical protein
MTTNEQVVRLWQVNCSGLSGTMLTTGEYLYSYGLLIGDTHKGMKRVYDYTSKGGRFISNTTSHHVGIARRYADVVVKVVQE